MKISICHIQEEGFVSEGQQFVRIEFSSTVVCGSAHLVTTNLIFRVGDELEVEIDYFRCENFVLNAPNTSASVQYNEDLDFYTINGLVTTVHEDGVFFVESGDFRVMLKSLDNLSVQTGNQL